jgi:hypothetical protein
LDGENWIPLLLVKKPKAGSRVKFGYWVNWKEEQQQKSSNT